MWRNLPSGCPHWDFPGILLQNQSRRHGGPQGGVFLAQGGVASPSACSVTDFLLWLGRVGVSCGLEVTPELCRGSPSVCAAAVFLSEKQGSQTDFLEYSVTRIIIKTSSKHCPFLLACRWSKLL